MALIPLEKERKSNYDQHDMKEFQSQLVILAIILEPSNISFNPNQTSQISTEI